jgi:hypothetical protein
LPEQFTLAEWALIVGIITTSVGAVYAVWKVVLRPMLVAANRRFSEEAFKKELNDLEHATKAVQSLGRLQAELIIQVEKMDEGVDKIPVLEKLIEANGETLERIEGTLVRLNEHIINLNAREGGRRRYDPK